MNVVAIVVAAATPIAPPICWLVLIRPDATPASDWPDAGERADRHRHEREREPDAAQQERREQIPEVVAVHRQLRVEHEPAGGQRETGGQHRADADAGHERLRDVRRRR